MFKKKYCLECSNPFRLGYECTKCKKPICFSCAVTLGSVNSCCIFCAKKLIQNRLKAVMQKKKFCLNCGEKIGNVIFSYCPYCGKTFFDSAKENGKNGKVI